MEKYSSFNLPEAEKLISCPYNKAHQVVAHRMGIHLVKCRRSHSTAGTKECRFNVCHVFAIDQISEHEANCPDRVMIERSLLQDQMGKGFIAPSCPVRKPQPDLDDWDVDSNPVVSYNPHKKCMNGDIIRHIQHGTPSQRKELRELEFIRITNLRGETACTEQADD